MMKYGLKASSVESGKFWFFIYGKEMDFLKALIGDEGYLVIVNVVANKTEKLTDIHLGSLVTKSKKINEPHTFPAKMDVFIHLY